MDDPPQDDYAIDDPKLRAVPGPRAYALLVDVLPDPAVQIIYDPLGDGTVLTVKVYASVNQYRFRAGEALQTLYMPLVTAGGASPTTPTATRVQIQTAINPDLPNDYLYYRTMTVATAAVPAGQIRHRLLLPGTPSPQWSGVVMVGEAELDDSLVRIGGQIRPYIITATGGAAFDTRWKRLRDGVDPSGPRDFFLQSP